MLARFQGHRGIRKVKLPDVFSQWVPTQSSSLCGSNPGSVRQKLKGLLGWFREVLTGLSRKVLTGQSRFVSVGWSGPWLETLIPFYFLSAGFEGVDDFFVHLRDHILECLRTKDNCDTTTSIPRPMPTTNTALEDRTTAKTAADKTAATNAANLKVSQKFILEQSGVIDCSSNNSDPVSINSSKWLRSKSSSDLKEEGASEKDNDPFLAQLRSNNNLHQHWQRLPSDVHLQVYIPSQN